VKQNKHTFIYQRSILHLIVLKKILNLQCWELLLKAVQETSSKNLTFESNLAVNPCNTV